MCKVTVRPEPCHSVKNLFTKMQLILAKSPAQSVNVALAVLGEHLDLLVFKVHSIKIILQFYIRKSKELCCPFIIIFHLKKELVNEGEETLAQGAQGDDATSLRAFRARLGFGVTWSMGGVPAHCTGLAWMLFKDPF